MATQTPNYNLDKPLVGGDTDVWGGMLNDNSDIIDTEMAKAFKTDGDGLEPNASPILRLGGFVFSLDGTPPALPADPETRTLIITVNSTVVFRISPDTAGVGALDFVATDPV
jgi:hypothetical protein